MGKRTNIGSRLHSVERGNVVAGANEILDDAKGKKQNVINNDVDAELVRLDQSKQDNLTFDNQPTEESDNPVKSGGVYAADKALSDAIEAILILIPSAATALNQLADKNFVNSSIATDTATFRGTSATGLSETQFLEWANGLTHDMNDYVFWQTIDEAGNTLFKRYKWNGTQWLYEYTLNNSSFTADQWAAIMSGITSALVEKLNGLPTNAALQQALNSKQDALTFDNVPTEGSTNPVKSGGVYSAVKAEEDARLNLAQTVSGIGGEVSQIEDVIPTGATSINKLVANSSMEAYVASIIQNITASFTLATTDGHINLTLTQVNGQVATLTLASSDIASAQALTALTGRVTTAEGNITSLTGRVSTNETDIANLQQLYNDLQQSKPVPVTALPSTGQQQGVIYRLAGTTSYSDYMWNGSTWVLMATYNNAIDPRPKKASQNLVTSGGVFDNMGALDVSELNATENPHTLAKYTDLSAALAAVPTDYQKGGMSIKFVQSSDNKYVQYRLTANTFTIDVTQWAVCDDGVYVENPEFVAAYTDKKKRLLFAIGKDGNFYFGAGCPQQIKDYISSAILYKVDKIEGKGLIDTEVGNSFEYVENPEYIAVGITKDKQILNAIYKDGHSYIYELSSESIDRILNRIKNIDETTEGFTAVEDPEERLKVVLDAVGKIIAYRDEDGILHENAGISSKVVNTDHLELTPHGMNDFKQALKDSGFNPGGAGDYSEKEYMYISEPRLAHLNIIGDVNMLGLSKEGMDGAIEGVNYNIPIQVEFTDDKGNYFLKYALLSGQGRSSLQFLKKGLGMDFFNEDPSSQDFDEDNVFTMKFGDWIPQDSFHIKSFYTDWPRCTTPVVYKLANEVLLTRGVLADRPFKKYYVGEYNEYGGASANTQSDLSHNMETGARCVPDGFPVIVYLNGEFWGVNSWQLKKHRDNYMLNKKKDTNIHLDGDFLPYREGSTPFWLYDGTIDWSMYCSGTYGIETRNPKNLYCIDGKKYDADSHDAEIITTAIAEEWIAAGQIIPTGKIIDDTLAGYLRTTGKVRKNIEDLTRYIPDINRLISGETLIDGQQATIAQIKAAIEDRFDVNSFIDYILINNVVGNDDAWSNNGQMVTWGKLSGSDNLNWSVNVYDCDVTFGCLFNGTGASPADGYKRDPAYPLYKIFWDYYYDELKARYHKLRDKGIFDADHITGLFRSWMNRVGYDNYKKEYKKWPESPCFRDGSQTYTNNPTTGGFYGSIERIYLWTKKRIEYMDGASFFDYSQN